MLIIQKTPTEQAQTLNQPNTSYLEQNVPWYPGSSEKKEFCNQVYLGSTRSTRMKADFFSVGFLRAEPEPRSRSLVQGKEELSDNQYSARRECLLNAQWLWGAVWRQAELTINAIAEPGASSKATEAKRWMPQARERSTANNIHQVGQPQFKKWREKKAQSQHSMKYDT